MTIPTPSYPYQPNTGTYYYTNVPKTTDPKLLEVLERIADALEELAY
jgi:hypothetical protein